MRHTFSLLFLVCAFVATSVVQAAGEKVNVPKPTGPHEVPSSLCGECHVEIYSEWKGSMHANSTALKDPIHAALYKNVMGDPTEEGVTSKKGKYPVCLRCHAPNAAMQKKTKLDAKPAFNEGVNCIFCHTISGYKGVKKPDGKLRLGNAAYEVSTTSLQAPSGKHYSTAPADESNSATPPFHPFPMQGTPGALHKTNEACLGCHEQRNNSHDVPLCITGPEFTASKSEVTCQSCHMPMVNGHVSHNMAGGHSAGMVRRAITLTLDVKKGEKSIAAKVTMKNQLPHNFPTGAPFRNAYLKLSVLNAQGDLLWQNYQKHPVNEDSKALFAYTLGDGTGKPSMPPKAKEVISDTRLTPHEKRTLEYEIQAEGASLLRAEVIYELLPPHLLKNLDKVLTDDLKTPKQAAIAEVRL